MAGNVTTDLTMFHRLQQEGASAETIAARLGTTTRTIQRYRARYGYSKPTPASRWRATPEWKADVARLAADGASQAEIARTTGVSIDTVKRHFPDAKWDFPTVGAHGAAVRKLNHLIGKK